MNPKFKKLLLILFPILLGVFLIWYFLNQFNEEQVGKIFFDIKNAKYFWIALSLFFGALSHLSRAYRWNYMFEPLGYKPRYFNNVLAVFISYLLNLAVPRSGEIGRATVISKYENIPVEKAFGTIVSERVADVIMLLFVILFAFTLQADLIKSYLFNEGDSNNYVSIIVLVTSAFLAFIGFRLIQKAKSGFLLKIKKFVNGLYEGVVSILKMKKKWPFIFHTIFIWLMYIMMFYAATFALPATNELSMGAVIVSFVAGSFAMMVTNGGFGAYPLFIAEALSLYGINEESGASFGLLMWSSQTLMVIIFGGLSFLLLPIYNRNRT